MKLKWPIRIRSRKDEEQVPPEVQEYYKTERRERLGLAWLLALATLFATVAVVLGLFFGGRWVIRQIGGDDKKPVATETTGGEAPFNLNETSPSPTADENTEQTPPVPTPSSAPVTTAPQNSNLPHTGPADTLAVFVITAVTGAGFYEFRLRRKLKTPA